jgi:site-specific DNA-methyltransferase (adenine-specific)
MDAQLSLFPHTEHRPAQGIYALSVEESLWIEEGDSMSKSRGQTRPSEAEPTGGLQPHLTTTHGLLYQADCLDFLAAVRSESIATVFADPPFNLQKEYKNGFKDEWEDDDYLGWSFQWIDECQRVLLPGGSLFIYVLPRWAYHFAAHLDGPMEFRHWIALSMKGTFPRGQKLYPAHYALLYFTKGKPRVFNRVRVPIPACRHCGGDLKDYGGHRKYLNPEGLNLTDFWEDTSPNRHRHSKARPGVNELKPMIPARAIEISTQAEDIVLDPFGGGGSTFQEAQRLGRYWIGSEIGHCDAIEQRFRSFAPTTMGRKPPRKVSLAISPEDA